MPCSVEHYAGSETIPFRDWLNDVRPVLARWGVARRLKSGANTRHLYGAFMGAPRFSPYLLLFLNSFLKALAIRDTICSILSRHGHLYL